MNSIKNFIFVLTLIFSVLNIKCEENEDLFVIFTQQLTPSGCYKKVNQKNPTCDELKNHWVISEFLHQLPIDPTFQCSEPVEELDPTTISTSTINELAKQWQRPERLTDPSITAKKIWRDFGGCTSKINEISNATNYFKKSFELHEKYNLNKILSEANITPGNYYKAQQISDAVSSATGGKKVLVRCAWKFGTADINLDMITIHLDKSFKPIDPVESYGSTTYVCPSDKLIRYNDGEHLVYEVTDYDAVKVKDYIRRIPTFKPPQPEEKLYGDPAVKYPTLLQDDNGYYVFEQKLVKFFCNEDDDRKCTLPKYPWYINLFEYKFNEDIKFDCERNSDNFDPKDISSIQNELSEKWNNKKDDVAEDFGFQWTYGPRCSAYFKGLDSPFKYYKKSIELFDKYNMDVILRESNIIPRHNYTFQAIIDAVSKGLKGTKADITCSSGGFAQSTDDLTIKIYFDQSFNLINKTNGIASFECPLDKIVRYEVFLHEYFSSDPFPLLPTFDNMATF
ncbi:uncharacterized protein LOC130674499 [Microplitis mediator]|uniref:uncharacterized protein LOC130674499 n=1 Tax=Microplitis mediator TaxID=375433 RepID=UPI002556D580|nr:uncharacterized protein LOC130674499 [Microplitis mediator]